MSSRLWIQCFVGLSLVGFIGIAVLTIYIDPFFHYHVPYTEKYFYTIDNERSQNDGIIKNFDYDAVVIGTSHVECFSTSEMDMLFGTNSIKVPFSGGDFFEINTNMRKCLETHSDIKIVVRGLEPYFFDYSAEKMTKGERPTYLYNDNPFDDALYIYNHDVLFDRTLPIMLNLHRKKPGITSFDDYANWMTGQTFGKDSVLKGWTISNIISNEKRASTNLSESEIDLIRENMRNNVISACREYPDVDFYYFLTPLSIASWYESYELGGIYRRIEKEKVAIEEILECENIRLFGFDAEADIMADLNNYRDKEHYGSWINSFILYSMKENRFEIRQDNYREYLDNLSQLVMNYDYESLMEQYDAKSDGAYGYEMIQKKYGYNVENPY